MTSVSDVGGSSKTTKDDVMSCFAGAQPFDKEVDNTTTGEFAVPNLTLLGQLPHFSFKNGTTEQAASLLVKATIPKAYHWRPIEDLPTERAKEYLGAYITSAYVGLAVERPMSIPEGKLMKAAMILGVARAVMTSFYSITPQELIPGETEEPIFKAVHRGAGFYEFVPKTGLSAKHMTALGTMPDMDQATSDAMPSVHMSAIGLPALQGWSLMMTGHHYLSEAGSQSRRAYMVVEKQFWRANNVAPFWNDDLDLCTDILWHKSGHPVSISLKHRYAADDEIKAMITKAGAGSAASRLPAKETELRAANSYLVLMQTVRSMYESYGGRLDYSVLDYVNEYAKSYPVDPSQPQKEIMRASGIPGWVIDRTSALRFLGEVMASNADVVAHAFGFYMAMTEQSALMGTAASNDTIKSSFSLTKLKNQSTAAYTAGYQAYSDYLAFTAKQRQNGVYNAVKLGIRHLGLVPSTDELPPE